MNTTTLNKLNRIVLIVIMGLMTLQSSCKKEEKEILETLNGTIWKYTYNYGEYYRIDYTLIFHENTFTWSWIDFYTTETGTKTETNTSTGTYVYNYPNIELYFEDGNPIPTIAIISGKQMSITGNEGMIFKKQ